MKVSKKLMSLALAAGLTLSVAAYAGNLSHSRALAAEGFGMFAQAGQMGPGAHRGPGGHGKGGHFGGPMMGMMMKDLNLTDAQKAEFKALFEQAKAQHQGQHPDIKAMKDKLKTAFLSNNFDANALRSELQANAPNQAAMADQMATNIVKAWKILTPEQQTKVIAKLDQMEQHLDKMRQKHSNGEHPGAQHLQKMAEQLQLNAEQKSQLQALWQSGQPNREEQFKAMRSVKQQVVAELKAASPNVDRISDLIEPMAQQGRQGMSGFLDKMAALHKILTPAQRTQLVSLMEEKMSQHRGHHGR